MFFPLGEAHGDIVFNLVRQNKNVFLYLVRHVINICHLVRHNNR